jgi:hypothetical protein
MWNIYLNLTPLSEALLLLVPRGTGAREASDE